MQGKLTSIPQVYFSFIDVQDAATAHINALKRGKHLGRYPLSNGNFKLSEYVQILAEQYKADGYSIPTGEMGICRVYFGSFFNDDALKYYHMWNIKAEVEGTHAENSLKFEYTKSAEESLMDMGDYFIDHGLI